MALHDVERCPMAEELLQGLISRGQIEIHIAKKKEREVFMKSSDINPSKPKPLVIHFIRNITTQIPRGFRPSVAKMPAPFPYKRDKVVPWRYGVQGSDGRQDASVMRVGTGMPAVKITNISATSGMTHSGCIFALLEPPTRSNDKGKAKADMGEREKIGLTANNEAPVEKFAKEGDDLSKIEISVEEATKFVRIIQQSEFKVIEQLNKMPTRISLLGLLMHSEPHRVMGLGWNNDGTSSLLKFAENRGRFGMGYEPTNADKRRISLERKERSLACSQGTGWMHEDQVAMLDEETNQDQPNRVQPCSPGF
ncbi:hypothetical protein GmHk_11G031978 [Glycine max]|nr:hypothetical protein GmHk_11G031978 [Glycine max]